MLLDSATYLCYVTSYISAFLEDNYLIGCGDS